MRDVIVLDDVFRTLSRGLVGYAAEGEPVLLCDPLYQDFVYQDFPEGEEILRRGMMDWLGQKAASRERRGSDDLSRVYVKVRGYVPVDDRTKTRIFYVTYSKRDV
jgi:hypothetical protein